jgi:biopolymer transport protein TolR
MASAGPLTGGGGRRKSLDAEINLVPFIDLLSMCICFLLMTAVWTQVGAVQVKQSHGTGAADPKVSFDSDVKFASPTEVEFTFKKQGRLVKKVGVKTATVEELPAAIDASLTKALAEMGNPEVTAAMVTPKAGVSYGDMVVVMDALRKKQIQNIGVVPVKAN